MSLNGFSPAYINVFLKPYIPTRTLRSSSLRLLTVPSVASKNCLAYIDRAFSIAAPREWNNYFNQFEKPIQLNPLRHI